MTFSARTGNSKKGISPQPYESHIAAVMGVADQNLQTILKYSTLGEVEQSELHRILSWAAAYHDLGKLDKENQKILSKDQRSRKSLPFPHADAGTAFLLSHFCQEENKKCWNALLKDKKKKQAYFPLSPVLVYAHHQGLPDFSEEASKGPYLFFRHESIRETNRDKMDGRVEVCRQIHEQLMQVQHLTPGPLPDELNLFPASGTRQPRSGLCRRLLLACLVDADRTDAARHDGNEEPLPPIACRWNERLKRLQAWVNERCDDTERSGIRSEVFHACVSAEVTNNVHMECCTSPVGTGKTTAVMARMLRVAAERNLRHIFVILPYTSIISQSVEVYRNSITLPGEKPEEVILEHHHLTEYKDTNHQLRTIHWNAPVIVTTAVQFFETLGGAHPGVLRNLIQLPGSGIFLDEAHAAMLAQQWPQQWKWMNELAEKWNCHWIFSSGSLTKYWDEPKLIHAENSPSAHSAIAPETPGKLPELIPYALHDRIQRMESRRVQIVWKDGINQQTLLENVIEDQREGPVLVIMNTIRSAASIAMELHIQGYHVRHLSTALAPCDRVRIIRKIREILESGTQKHGKNLILVATNCVEAGCDFSFRTAWRECDSIVSLLQTCGRVNRHMEKKQPGQVTCFLFEKELCEKSSGLRISQDILRNLFKKKGGFDPCDTEKLLQEEIRRMIQSTDIYNSARNLVSHEEFAEYRKVAQECRIIQDEGITAVVCRDLADRMMHGEMVRSQEIQWHSVEIRRTEEFLRNFEIEKIPYYPGLYRWNSPYDQDLLGYMTEEILRN